MNGPPPQPPPGDCARGTDSTPLAADNLDLTFPLENSDPPTNVSTPKKAPVADDSPTIISRAQRGPARPDEAISTQLRGRTLAHFELREAVGIGGMAAVLRAQDTQLDRPVALKILPPQMAADPESIRRFHQEARSAARLDHENIARVFYCGEDQGLHFIAFEYVEGENLRMILDRRGRLPAPEAIHYMLQVATGLAHAAARGVVHRDIKPSNIVITPTGRAKLVDMGLARSLGPSSDGELTQSGVTLGTFDYISPEQALEPRDADARSDIYSLGCTFYHMLTGHAPVPEGTAAKKLHCHQHIAPLDPRQLNPLIPDDVAAILSRMMAKDPKDRYQRPEHLVQHLILLAQKLGCSTDVPESMLFVDAPLPSPPRARPVLIGGVAAVVLIGLVMLLGALPNNSGSAPELKFSYGTQPRQATNTERERPPPEEVPKKDTDPRDTVPAGPKWVTVRTVKELAEQLKQRVAWVRLAGEVFDLKRDEGSSEVPGLVFRGDELLIEPEDAKRRPTIRLKHEPIGSVGQLWAALTVQGGKATVSGVRFVVDATGTGTPMSALAPTNGGTVAVKDCEFQQLGAAEDADQRHLTSVLVPAAMASSGAPRSSVILERCFFRRGDHALTLLGSATVQFVDCAFGPHLSLFQLRGPRVRETEVALRHCSALLEAGTTALHLDGGASCKLVANHCLISCPHSSLDPDGDGAVLVRQTGDQLGDLRYEIEHRNVYHNLAAFWVRESSARGSWPVAATLEEFQVEMLVNRGDRSVAVGTNPWQHDQPLALLEKKPEQAFLVNLKAPDLRQDDNPTKKLVGIEQCLWAPLYPADLPPVEEVKPEPVQRKTKIVDPTAKESGNGRYRTLRLAIEEANPGDEILIKHTGLLPVEPIRLEKAQTDVTIKPYRQHKPILTLGGTTERDAALFRLHDGKLKFEDLEFQLEPSRAEFKAQTVVMIIGDGLCEFRGCLLTLASANNVPLSAVTLMTDPNSVMQMDPQGTRTQVARVHLENCFVRGGGDFMTVRSSRPFALEANDTLAALDGSFLVVDGNPKEVAQRPAVQIVLKQVTTYLGEHLICLRKDEARANLVPTQVVQAFGCLFHSSKGNRSLVHLDGVETEEQMRRAFAWGEGRQNVYSGYLQLLDQLPPRDSMATIPPYDQEKWKTFTSKDTDGRFQRARFPAWPVAELPLSKSWPVNFRVRDPDGGKVGVTVEKLRSPSNEGETAPSPPENE